VSLEAYRFEFDVVHFFFWLTWRMSIDERSEIYCHMPPGYICALAQMVRMCGIAPQGHARTEQQNQLQ
jgi:hypothetical protein